MGEREPIEFPWSYFLDNLETLVGEAGSAEHFCSRVGISFWTYNAWRTRTMGEPKLGTLQGIAEAFDVTVDDLLSRKLPR